MFELSPTLQSIVSALLASKVIWWSLFAAGVVLVFRSAWFKGLLGELFVRLAMKLFLNQQYRRLHNIILEPPDGSTQIDHVIVSPFGVFVVETKNFRGWIFGNPQSNTWTQSIYGKKFTFQNPLHQNYKHTKAVEAVTGINPAHVHSVVVFVGDSEFKTPMPPHVTGPGSFIRYIKSKGDVVLFDEDIEAVLEKLQIGKASVAISNPTHVENLKANVSQPKCPRCGADMILRTVKKGPKMGSEFWGCANFPRCRIVKNIA